jgi:hypothetical protein
MDIQVPRHTNLEIEVFSSPVKVTGVNGHGCCRSLPPV